MLQDTLKFSKFLLFVLQTPCIIWCFIVALQLHVHMCSTVQKWSWQGGETGNEAFLNRFPPFVPNRSCCFVLLFHISIIIPHNSAMHFFENLINYHRYVIKTHNGETQKITSLFFLKKSFFFLLLFEF